MTQTLNFAVNVDQSQIPAIFQQVQSGISAQLQAGSMQLGNMTANVANMMTGMSAMGGNPAATTMAYSMSPGAVNHSLGKQPFIDHYGAMADFSNQAYGAVMNRASSIITATPFGPKTASYSQQMASTVIGGMGDAITSIGAMGLANKLIPGAGFFTSAIAWAGAESILKPMIGDKIGRFGRHMTGVAESYEPGTKAYADKMGQMVAARDIGALALSMGPQKYTTTSMGMAITPQAAARFGGSIQEMLYDMGKRSGDLNYLKMAAGGQFMGRAMMHIAAADPEGQKMVNGWAYAASSGSGLTPGMVSNSSAMIAKHNRMAIAMGAYGAADPLYHEQNMFAKYGSPMPEYTGPNKWQLMGRQIGFQTGLGRGVGEELMNRSVRRDASRDLGMSSEQREMLGGKYAFGAQYGAMIATNASTFGSAASIMLAGMYGTGNVPEHATEMGPAAARGLAGDKNYWQFRLNYKDIASRAGGKGLRSAHIMQVGLMAEHLMKTSQAGSFKNTWEARQAVYLGQGYSPEQAAAYAGMDESVGQIIQSKGTGSSSLIDIYGSAEKAKAALNSMTAETLKSIGLSKGAIDDKYLNIKAFDRKKFGAMVGGLGPVSAAAIQEAVQKGGGDWNKTIAAAGGGQAQQYLMQMKAAEK